MKIKFVQLLIAGAGVLLISCNNTASDTALEQKINDIGDQQKVLLKKIENMDKSINKIDKSINNLALANKNKPADNKKAQPPKADPNKVYNVPIGDSFSIGPDNAAVTIIEWSDFQ
mgnify:CR=1 FL=1|tara:strand:- start:25 stop:372 length:348 start_codon:yes stop_codon:yes gene_type:complete